MSTELAYMSAVDLGRAIRSRQVSSVEVTEMFYLRIERLDPRLNSYLALCQDQAMADARAADDAVERGWALGPLHGIPISIKDLEMSRGIPHHSRFRSFPRPHSGDRFDSRGASEGRRSGGAGQDQHAGIRSVWHHREQGKRPLPQPVEH